MVLTIPEVAARIKSRVDDEPMTIRRRSDAGKVSTPGQTTQGRTLETSERDAGVIGRQ
jgi:hypothetical protein